VENKETTTQTKETGWSKTYVTAELLINRVKARQ